MTNSFIDQAPTPLDVLVEYIHMKPTMVGARILEDIVTARSLPATAEDIWEICIVYLPGFPLYERKESIAIANKNLHRNVPYAVRPTVDVYTYAVYERYRALHRLIESQNVDHKKIYGWIESNHIDAKHASPLAAHLKRVHGEFAEARASMVASGFESVTVHDAIVALSGVIDHAAEGGLLRDEVRHFACIYDACTGRSPGGRIGRVFSYVLRKSQRS